MASKSAALGGAALAEIGDRAKASSAMANSSRKSLRVIVTITMIRRESQLY
jgi:hypothetical protein